MEAIPSAADCCSPCPDDLITEIPGSPGAAGAAGADGTDGENAYTTLTAPFEMPGYGLTDTADVVNSAWMAIGQKVFIGRPDGGARGTFEVVDKVDSISVELLNLDDNASAYTDNSPPTTVFATASVVSPSGLQGSVGVTPGGGLLAVNNLGDVANAATSRTNLGLGTMAVQNANLVAITGGSIAIAAGGTGAATAQGAINNLSPLTTLGDILTHDGANNVRRAVGASLNMIPRADGAGDWQWAAFSSIFGGVSIINDQVASGGAAEAIALAAWTKARLQFISLDPAANVISLAASVFVLRAGTYLFLGAAPPTQVFCRFRIRNTTAAANYQGVQVRTLNNSASMLPFFGMFTAAAGDTFEWQYYCQNDGGGGDFGYAMSTGDVEIFKSLLLLKLG